MSLPNFQKFGSDCGLVFDQHSSAAFTLLFAKTTRRRSGANPRLTFHSFAAAIARLILDRRPSISVDDIPATVVDFFSTRLSKAHKWEPLPPIDDQLQAADVTDTLAKETAFLSKVWIVFSYFKRDNCSLLRVLLTLRFLWTRHYHEIQPMLPLPVFPYCSCTSVHDTHSYRSTPCDCLRAGVSLLHGKEQLCDGIA